MRRFFHLVLIIALLTAFAGCSTRRHLDLTKSSTQLDVGVRAAKDNLWREALFRFQRAVQIDPANAMAQNNLAVAYEGTGEFEKARQAYTEALRLDRSNEYIQKNYSRFVEFYSKNRKREQRRPPEVATTETAAATGAESDDDAPAEPTAVPAATPEPPAEPGPVPVANPEPPTTPVTSPPDTNKPDSPPKGVSQ
jgi:tetratricopeptide (TPR) repeat protein